MTKAIRLLQILAILALPSLAQLNAEPTPPAVTESNEQSDFEEKLRKKIEAEGLEIDESSFNKILAQLKAKNIDPSTISFRKPNDAGNSEFVGKPGPKFEVKEWISEKPDLEGKFLLIDFWATWCGPCIRAIPHMNELNAEFKDEVTFVGVSRETRAKVEAMTSPVMEYYSAIDPKGSMQSYFNIRGIPHVVLMAPDGIVLFKGHPNSLSADTLRSLISGDRS